MQGGTPTTVGKLADELGLPVEQVLDGCRQAGLSTFGAGTPLDGREADRIRYVLAGAPAAPAAPPGAWQPLGAPVAPPPPPGTAAAPLPPPPGGFRPPGLPQPPPQQRPRRWGRPAWGAAGVAAYFAVRVGLRLFLASNDTDDGESAAPRFDEIEDSLEALSEREDDDPGVASFDAPEGMKYVVDLAVGDCWSDPLVIDQTAAEGEVELVDVVPCDQPHQAEVFHVDAYVDPPGTPFPGNERLAPDAEARCAGAWEAYVGLPLDQSVFNLTYTFPTQRSWLLDDRTINCSLYPLDGTLLTTGARGVAR